MSFVFHEMSDELVICSLHPTPLNTTQNHPTLPKYLWIQETESYFLFLFWFVSLTFIDISEYKIRFTSSPFFLKFDHIVHHASKRCIYKIRIEI